MAKLYFRHGAMSSAKTLNLLAVAYNYEAQGKRVCLIKPTIDDRFGRELVKSRAGLERKADFCVEPNEVLNIESLKEYDCILVDECQFFSEKFIDFLRKVTIECNIPVICYGLRTNFKSKLFEGSQRLFEVADSIEEIKTTCAFCNSKAVLNLKLKVSDNDNEIELGADELYKPVCCKCYYKRMENVYD